MFARNPLALLLTTTFLAAPVAGQAADPGLHEKGRLAPGPDEGRRHQLYVGAQTVIDAEVVGRDDTAVGELKDLVIDARNARALIAVVATRQASETTDARRVAVPYGLLRWHAESGALRLETSGKNLAKLPRFDPEALSGPDPEARLSMLRGVFGDLDLPLLPEPETLRRDEYTLLFGDAQTTTIAGRITDVKQGVVSIRGSAEEIVVTIEDDDRREHRVLLGPAWFVTRQMHLPAIGDRLTGKVVQAADRSGATLHVAQRVKFAGGGALRLRDDRGMPAFNANKAAPGKPLYAPVTALIGGPLLAGGEPFGSVDDVILEIDSGRTAYLAVSSEGSRYPVPWNAAGFGDGLEARVEMDAAKMSRAPRLDKGPADLNDPALRRRVAMFYQQKRPPPGVRNPGPPTPVSVTLSPTGALEGWTGDGAIARHYRKAEPVAFDGRVVALERRRLGAGAIEPAMCMLVLTAGERVRVVCAGPAWFAVRQIGGQPGGQAVRVEGRIVELDGEEVVIASSIEDPQGATVRLWDDGWPRWDASPRANNE